MNKKFSTLLAMSLLMAGSAFSSAWADQIKTLVAEEAATSVGSDQYVIVQTIGTDEYVFGFEKQDDGTLKQIVVPFAQDIAAADLAKYAWTITQTNSPFAPNAYSYSFKNVSTGNLLRVTKDITEVLSDGAVDPKVAVVTDPSVADANTYSQFVFAGFNKYDGANGSAFAVFPNNTVGPWNYVKMVDVADTLQFVKQGSDNSIKFYKIAESGISDNALNSLYNNGGFSFALKDGKGVANIFDQRLLALDVKENVTANEQTNPGDWGFPKGTYFVTEYPYVGFDNDWSNEDKYAYLKACKFIVLSSTESEEVTADDRAKGQGFKLVEMTGAQLYKYMGTATANKVSGDEVSVYNACFQVTGLSTNEYPYAINNSSFRYLAKADASSAADKVHKTAAVSLKVLKIGGVNYLTTVASADKNFIFKFGESGVVKGISLLKSDAPAVYNIRFVSGYSDRTELNKYLTVGLADDDQNWDLVAKGEALANNVLATPAYQFVITNVNGNDVTFTNRETGKSFTTKLFDEGNGVYSMTAADELFVANINRSSYGVDVTEWGALKNTRIELTESEVDPYAGFWNVADGTMVTLGFSRDVNNTSNIVYAYEYQNALTTNGYANLTGDLYDAAQWELNAIPSWNNGVITIKRDYVYNNNDKVAVEPFGDVVSLQKYYIQYVKDAEETGKFMTYANNQAPTLGNGIEYVIRQNADGSVSIMRAADVIKNSQTTVGGVNSAIQQIHIYPIDNRYQYDTPSAYTVAKTSTNVNTYLLTEAPYKSWDKEGYASIKTEVGNYLSMNEKRDGIVLDNDPTPYYLHMTDKNAVAPSFFISKSLGTMEGERLFMFNAVDSIGYQMVGKFDPKYQWSEGNNKIIFKTAILNETADTLALTVKGEVAKYVANKSNNKENVWEGLDRFKWQVIEAEDGHYLIRQNNNGVEAGKYLTTINEKLTWGIQDNATHFVLAESDRPTANEAIAAEAGVQVIGGQGVVTVQGAAGKVITVANILGQTIANQVAASDNVTIAAPAGVVVVAVDGEATKVVVK